MVGRKIYNDKKLFSFILAIFILLIPVTTYAKVSSTDFVAGGVYIGQPVSEVVSIYGMPISVRPAAGKGEIYSYGQYGTVFDIRTSGRETVEGVISSGNNGVATKGGIKYGSHINQIKAAYGTPDFQGYNKYNGNYVIEYNYNPSKNYSLVLHFDIKNEWVIGFYLNRYPNYG